MGGAMMGLGTGLEQLGAMLGQFGMGQIKNKQDQESKWQEAMMGVGINPKTGQQDPEFLRAAETFYKAKGYSPKEQAEAALLQQLGMAIGGGGMSKDETGAEPASSDIMVKLKSTGEIGTIPANEWDPKLYERAQ